MKYRAKHPDLETEAESTARTRAYCKTAFAEHVITRLTETVWKCARPSTWIYGFYVARIPGGWVIYGDIGDVLVTRCDSLGWLQDAAGSPHYFAEKMPVKQERFYPGDALEELDEHLKDGTITAQQAENIYESVDWYDEYGAYEVYARAMYEHTGDPEMPVHKGLDYGVYRCLEAVKWFCERVGDIGPAPWHKKPAHEGQP